LSISGTHRGCTARGIVEIAGLLGVSRQRLHGGNGLVVSLLAGVRLNHGLENAGPVGGGPHRRCCTCRCTRLTRRLTASGSTRTTSRATAWAHRDAKASRQRSPSTSELRPELFHNRDRQGASPHRRRSLTVAVLMRRTSRSASEGVIRGERPCQD
jgi:hypothetical protein